MHRLPYPQSDLYSPYPHRNYPKDTDPREMPIDPNYSYNYLFITRDKSMMNSIISSMTQFSKICKANEDLHSPYPVNLIHKAIINLNQVNDNNVNINQLSPASIINRDYSSATKPQMSSTISKSLVMIQNKDEQLVTAVLKCINNRKYDGDIVYYQMCYQYWKRRSDILCQRSVVITPSIIMLCYEELNSKDVELLLLDSSPFKSITGLKIDKSNPCMMSVYLRDSGLFSQTRKWRFYLNNRNLINKLYEMIKSSCARVGNNL